MSQSERNEWIEAAKEKVIFDEGQTDKVVKEIMYLYDEAAFEVENRINALFSKYAKENSLTSAEANRLLSGEEYSVWRKSIDKYFAETVADAADSKTLLELNTLAMKSRISREEKLLADVYRHMAELANDTSTDLTALLGDITRTSYYRSCFNIQKGIGACFEVGKISDRVIEDILKYPWAKKKFSKTVWDNVDTISALTKRVITKGFISGSGCQKMVKEINDVMGKGKEAAERVVRTECKYFANQGELQGYKENGITQYVFMGGSEGSAHCDCAFYNEQIIDVDKAEAGVNFPPMHPNCLCTIRAHFELSVFGDRSNVTPLDKNIKYQEWKDKFVQGDTTANFDLDVAKEKYQGFLQSVPKKNKMYLDFYSGITEYVDNPNFNGTFAYSQSMDKIIFNSSHPAFKNMDFNLANTHELAHRIDILYSKSWLNKKFVAAVRQSEKNVIKFTSILENQSAIDEQGFFSDIISALSHDRLTLNYGHNSEYWDIPFTKEREVFANIFCLETCKSEHLYDIKAYFPNIYDEYLNLMGD